jgi:two-component system, OmpR family, sensor histidine kinase KdpD
MLVCVSEDRAGAGLIRYAKRLADRLHAPWTALYVETARYHRLAEHDRDRIADCLRLAEKLGGEAITIPGGRIADDVTSYAQSNNISQIVIGKSERSRWFEIVHGSVVYDGETARAPRKSQPMRCTSPQAAGRKSATGARCRAPALPPTL